MSNLRDLNAYRDAAWDWSWLNEVLSGARLSDADGMVEQWGHLLLVEAKPLRHHWGPRNAQRRAQTVFATRPGQVSLCLYGDNHPPPSSPSVYAAESCTLGQWSERVTFNNTAACSWVRLWFRHARSGCDPLTCRWDCAVREAEPCAGAPYWDALRQRELPTDPFGAPSSSSSALKSERARRVLDGMFGTDLSDDRGDGTP